MTEMEVPSIVLTRMIMDLLEDEEDHEILKVFDRFSLTPPSPEGMELERALSRKRLAWADVYGPQIDFFAAVAANVSVCFTLDEPANEEEIAQEVSDVAVAARAFVRTIFGQLAQMEFDKGQQECRTTSG